MSLPNRVCFQVNLRDRLCCRLCGRQPASRDNYHKGFGYHHVVHKSDGGPDTPDNIVLLCQPCHQALHQRHKTLNLPINNLAVPACLTCNACQNPLNSNEVEMNCGWYRCQHCHQQTHLYDHFYSNKEAQPLNSGRWERVKPHDS